MTGRVGDRYWRWQLIGDRTLIALLTPFPPVRAGLRPLAKLPRVGGLSFVRSMLTPASANSHEFGGDGARLLLAGNACHADIPLDLPAPASSACC